jgi:hypothetical protein
MTARAACAAIASLATLALASHASALTFVSDRAAITAAGGATLNFPITDADENQTYTSPLVAPLPTGGTVTIHDALNADINVRTDDAFLLLTDFLPSDTVLATGNFAPLTLEFSEGIGAFGTQVNTAHFGAFTAKITAFDANGAALGSFTATGARSNTHSGNSPFLGVTDAAGSIRKIQLDVFAGSTTTADAVYINGITVAPPVGATPPAIPEPASAGLLALSAGAMAFRLTRRR